MKEKHLKNPCLLIPAVVFFLWTMAAASYAADNLEPALSHPEQQKQAESKLAALEKKISKKPNILIFIVDDLGWGDPGAFGGGEAVGAPTPSIDRLAREGLKLTSTYAQPTCSPTRGTLNTGRLPIRHGIWRPPLYNEPGGVDGEITAAGILSDSGYKAAMVGKWHLGENKNQQPQNVGYDEFFGFLGVSTIYTDWRDEHFNPEVVYKKERYDAIEKAPFNKNLVAAKKGEDLREIKEITIPVMAQIDQDFADYSDGFIRRMAEDKKPFYLIHAFSKVHYDNYPAKGYAGKSPAAQVYKDAVVEVDDIVGRLIKTLEETGQAENTFVFFTSDNGPEEDTWPDSGHTPFRGAKGSTWEGGVRVPVIAWWPGTIPAGRVSDGLFDLGDLFNTSLSLAGVTDKIPTDRYIDGIDQSSFLLADNGMSNRKSVYMYIQNKFTALRWQEYKYHRYIVEVGDGEYTATGSIQNSKLVEAAYGLPYNLYLDPKERKPIGIRKLWTVPIFGQEGARHMKTFVKYPPKKPQVVMPGR
jgi:arylsulfatase A-like enzyme